MADPDAELERILTAALSQLNGIRLELPSLEDGRPAPLSPQVWAAESLSPARPKEELQRVRSVELPPPPPLQAPAAEPSPQPAPQVARPQHPGMIAAVLLLATGFGLWWSLRATQTQTVLPLASYDAIAARGPAEWLVSRQRELLLYDASSQPRVLARLLKPLTALFWTDGTLYGIDGGNTLFLWESMEAPAQVFSLDHVPTAIYARPPHVWTLDDRGSLRQFLLARSMTGVFLQPLDRVEVRHWGDFSLADDGTLLLLERSSGQLLGLTRENSVYTVTTRGASYGAGARLLASSHGLWIAQVDAEKTTLVLITKHP